MRLQRHLRALYNLTAHEAEIVDLAVGGPGVDSLTNKKIGVLKGMTEVAVSGVVCRARVKIGGMSRCQMVIVFWHLKKELMSQNQLPIGRVA